MRIILEWILRREDTNFLNRFIYHVVAKWRALVNTVIYTEFTEFFWIFSSSSIPKNTTFRKLDLFPSSDEGEGEDTYSVGPLREN
jgi:hypothetical protein